MLADLSTVELGREAYGVARFETSFKMTSTPLFLATAITVLSEPKSTPTTDMVTRVAQPSTGQVLSDSCVESFSQRVVDGISSKISSRWLTCNNA